MMSDSCKGGHEIYVADVVGYEASGTIVVITVCRHCDMVNFHEHHGTRGRIELKSKGN